MSFKGHNSANYGLKPKIDLTLCVASINDKIRRALNGLTIKSPPYSNE